jgi:hypothetical protein
MIASLWTLFIPLYIAGGLVLLFAAFALLARFRGGRYVRPIVMGIAKVPFLRKLMTRASRKALEKQNPELASAIKKLERSGAMKDPQRAQAAMSRLTAEERRAWLDAVGEQQETGAAPLPTNRAERRRLERMQRGGRRNR